MNTFAANMAMCSIDMAVYSSLRGIAVCFSNQQCSLITSARNSLARAAISFDPKATHILWVDSDMMFPMDGLERLLSHDRDVVGAFYNKRVPPYETVGHLVGEPDISKGGLYPADVMPHGFVLIKREVFERLNAPWYFESFDESCITDKDPYGLVGEDVNFSRSCTKAGIEMWCDADLTFECSHIGEIAVPCLRPTSEPVFIPQNPSFQANS